MKLEGCGAGGGTQLLDLPRDLLELIAQKAAVGGHYRWVALWHVCRRLRWLVLLGEDAPEESVIEAQEVRVWWPGCRGVVKGFRKASPSYAS